jgi:hypothetical protein
MTRQELLVISLIGEMRCSNLLDFGKVRANNLRMRGSRRRAEHSQQSCSKFCQGLDPEIMHA